MPFAESVSYMQIREAIARMHRHLTIACAVLTMALIIAEWLVPGFVLPYVPLWPFPTMLGVLIVI